MKGCPAFVKIEGGPLDGGVIADRGRPVELLGVPLAVTVRVHAYERSGGKYVHLRYVGTKGIES